MQQIIWKKTSEVIPYEKNPRKNDAAVEHVANSLQEFGWKQPIVVDKDFVIIAGHTRLKAAKKLKMETVPVIVADDLNEQQVKAYRLADNKVAEVAEWDMGLLDEELGDIFDFDMADFGFDFEEEEEPQEVVEDEVPEVDEDVEPVAKLGDIWQLGRHRLMCGDSFDQSMLNALINNEELDLVMTDPPYDMEMGGQGCFAESMKHCKNRLEDIIHFDPYKLDFLPKLSAKSFYVFTSKNGIPKYFEIFKDMNFNIIVWCKTNCPPFTSGTFLPDMEYMLFFSKPGQKIWNNSLKPTEVYKKYYITKSKQGTEDAGTDEHPTIKPLQILVDKIRISSNENGGVLDLFGGSGSTLIACEQTGRKCFMMEYSPKYVDVIIKRWENLTGEKAVLLN